MTVAKNACQNCGKKWTEEQLEEITHGYWERVSPGEICPSGECPKCGALCHPDDETTRARSAGPDLLAALRECVTDEGAAARRNPLFALRRIDAINETIKKALEAVK